MHRNVPWRRLLFALAVPVVAIGGVALTAGVAASSTGGVTTAATDQPVQPNQPAQPTGGGGGGGGGTQPQLTGNPQAPATQFTLRTLSPGTRSPVTKSPTASPTKSPTKTPTKSGTASPGASPGGSPGGVVPVPVPGGPGGTAGACPTTMTPPVTVQVGTVAGKQALLNQAGCAIYMLQTDTPNQSACDATCLQQWPIVPGPAQAGTGANQSKLNVFNRPDGTVQATYGGHQLYTFTGDKQPGVANGQNVNQFNLIDANGNPITS
jgi:predicted lipoprotein with Yx(FWY)xxD motif